MTRKILFLTGTRADFGKLKSLIQATESVDEFEAAVFITGMHTLTRYGYTVDEVYRSLSEHRLKDGTRSVYVYHNQVQGESMERILANTIEGLSRYVSEFRPDLIVVHGDRVEALAGAIVGALRNVLVAHIEGGEVSGTIDELIRHAITKMSHIHFVANDLALKRLLQLGEKSEMIYVIGSPDIDLMLSNNLPQLSEVKNYYDITFREYAVVLYHPVTTDLKDTEVSVKAMVDSILESKTDYIIIYPNNDEGCELIFSEYKRLEGNSQIKLIPSMRIEYFLVLLKYARFLLGNSSAGIRECPVYGVPTINISSRQTGRGTSNCVIHVPGDKLKISEAINSICYHRIDHQPDLCFGNGDSAKLFLEAISREKFWQVSTQKYFNDIA